MIRLVKCVTVFYTNPGRRLFELLSDFVQVGFCQLNLVTDAERPELFALCFVVGRIGLGYFYVISKALFVP
jgi:hypothetical protein